MAAIAITAANVVPSSGAGYNYGFIAAGVTVTQGQLVWKQDSDGLYILADANGTLPTTRLPEVAATAGSPGQPIVTITRDPALVIGGTLSLSNIPMLSPTPGGITQTDADVITGCLMISLGAATSVTVLNFEPVVGALVP